MIGIYKITNTINGKVYIGQSKVSIERRWKEHLRKYKTGGYQIYQAMRKHGFENFKFEVIAELLIKDIDRWEIFYIELYDSLKNGYNASPGGNSNPHSKETKRKISLSMGGTGVKGESDKIRRKLLNKGTDNKVKVKCIETNEIFNSLKEAAKKYNTTNNNICMASNGKRKTAVGYHWIRI